MLRLILNPAAGSGRAGPRWQGMAALAERLLGPIEVLLTGRRGEARRLATDAAVRGDARLLCGGGDGTMNEVANGLLDAGVAAPPVLWPLPLGTSSDLCRNLGLPGDPETCLRALAGGADRRLDLLHAECAGRFGPVSRHALSNVAFGAPAEVARLADERWPLKQVGGRFAYYAAALAVTLRWGNPPARLTLDGEATRRLSLFGGVVCNGARGGGGMLLAPEARLDDAVADLLLFSGVERLDLLRQRPDWLYRGGHVGHPAVSLRRLRRLRVEADRPTPVGLDGETIGRLPLEVKLRPAAIVVRGVWTQPVSIGSDGSFAHSDMEAS